MRHIEDCRSEVIARSRKANHLRLPSPKYKRALMISSAPQTPSGSSWRANSIGERSAWLEVHSTRKFPSQSRRAVLLLHGSWRTDGTSMANESIPHEQTSVRSFQHEAIVNVPAQSVTAREVKETLRQRRCISSPDYDTDMKRRVPCPDACSALTLIIGIFGRLRCEAKISDLPRNGFTRQLQGTAQGEGLP